MEQLINNIGFPFTCVLACGSFIYKMQQQQREDTNKREERMFEQMSNVSSTLNNINTTMVSMNSNLENLAERVERLEEQNG